MTPSHSPTLRCFGNLEDLAEFCWFVLARCETGPVDFDEWVEGRRRIERTQHVASLGQFTVHGQLLRGLLQGQVSYRLMVEVCKIVQR